MPNWSKVIQEIQEEEIKNKWNPHDNVRQRYLSDISKITWRNTIAYYSGWLQRPLVDSTQINDKDMGWFMLVINWLDCAKWVDVILHTPWWEIAATEGIVNYLKSKFWDDIRVIVPQLAMSAWTMIALASKEIVMGNHSSLWPIDPQIKWVPCQAIIEEFERAKSDIALSTSFASVWNPILNKYPPGFLWACENTIRWADELANDWLFNNMCKWDLRRVKKITEKLWSHKKTKNHGRHISKNECIELWLNVTHLESNQDLQEAVLTAHHCFMISMNTYSVSKIIENQKWTTFIENISSI